MRGVCVFTYIVRILTSRLFETSRDIVMCQKTYDTIKNFGHIKDIYINT